MAPYWIYLLCIFFCIPLLFFFTFCCVCLFFVATVRAALTLSLFSCRYCSCYSSVYVQYDISKSTTPRSMNIALSRSSGPQRKITKPLCYAFKPHQRIKNCVYLGIAVIFTRVHHSPLPPCGIKKKPCSQQDEQDGAACCID